MTRSYKIKTTTPFQLSVTYKPSLFLAKTKKTKILTFYLILKAADLFKANWTSWQFLRILTAWHNLCSDAKVGKHLSLSSRVQQTDFSLANRNLFLPISHSNQDKLWSTINDTGINSWLKASLKNKEGMEVLAPPCSVVEFSYSSRFELCLSFKILQGFCDKNNQSYIRKRLEWKGKFNRKWKCGWKLHIKKLSCILRFVTSNNRLHFTAR